MANRKSEKKGRRGLLIFVAVVAVAGAVGAGVYYRARAGKAPNPADLYPTTAVSVSDVRRTVSGEAKLETTSTSALFVESPQTVKKVHIKVGDEVTAGQTLIEFDYAKDSEELTRQLAEARLYLDNALLSLENIARPAGGNDLLQYESAVTSAEKNVADTKAEIESLRNKITQQELRVENLKKLSETYEKDFKAKKIDEEDYDNARTNYLVAESALLDLNVQLEARAASLETYEKQLENARRKLENASNPLADEATASKYAIQENLVQVYTLSIERINAELAKLTRSVKSPADGYVVSLNAEEGSISYVSAPLIEIGETASPVVRFEASEYDAPSIALGQEATVTAAGLPDAVFGGEVSKIAVRAEKKSGSDDDEIIVPVEITLSELDPRLKIGYTLKVEIVTDRVENVPNLPIQAVAIDGDERYVWLIRDSELVRTSVEVGFFGDRTVEIISGLEEGDIVVTSPTDIPD